MFTKEQGRPLGKDGPKVTGATNAVDASTITDPGDGVVVDLAVERRRRRPWRGPDPAWFCPQRYGAHRSAAIAELSERLGSLDAAYRWLDQQRAAVQALAEARRAAIVEAIDRLSWLADQETSRRAWFAAAAEVPRWAAGEGWPEPGGVAS